MTFLSHPQTEEVKNEIEEAAIVTKICLENIRTAQRVLDATRTLRRRQGHVKNELSLKGK